LSTSTLRIRIGSLIVEKSYIFANPSKQHTVKNYGIVLSIDGPLGVEILWSEEGNITFHHKESVEWFTSEETTKYLDHTITKFWTIYY
tara:strand:- start:409 stop:672 length:264 start_codon:yes stop_codon:yes gene_type:complete